MIEFTVAQAAVSCQWAFKDSFISIPEPGDEVFAVLYKRLQPFRATLLSMTYQEDPQNLAEDALILPLFDGRLRLRIGHAGFDFTHNDLLEKEEWSYIDLLKALSEALDGEGCDLEHGNVRFIYEAFIHLSDVENESFLKQHLNSEKAESRLVPDTFAYQVVLRDAPTNPKTRLLFARSISPNFPKALYVHFTSDYLSPGEPSGFMKQVIADWHEVMASLDLKMIILEGEENATK